MLLSLLAAVMAFAAVMLVHVRITAAVGLTALSVMLLALRIENRK